MRRHGQGDERRKQGEGRNKYSCSCVFLCVLGHRYTHACTQTQQTERPANVHNRCSVVLVCLVVWWHVMLPPTHLHTRTQKSHTHQERPSPYEASENNTLFMIRALTHTHTHTQGQEQHRECVGVCLLCTGWSLSSSLFMPPHQTKAKDPEHRLSFSAAYMCLLCQPPP